MKESDADVWRRVDLPVFTNRPTDGERQFAVEQFATIKGKWGLEPCKILAQHDVDALGAVKRYWLPDAVITKREPIEDEAEVYHLYLRGADYEPMKERGPFSEFRDAASYYDHCAELF